MATKRQHLFSLFPFFFFSLLFPLWQLCGTLRPAVRTGIASAAIAPTAQGQTWRHGVIEPTFSGARGFAASRAQVELNYFKKRRIACERAGRARRELRGRGGSSFPLLRHCSSLSLADGSAKSVEERRVQGTQVSRAPQWRLSAFFSPFRTTCRRPR